MRVCVICREHPTLHFNGGLSIAAWNTARAARDAGVQVEFVTAAADPPDFVESEQGYKVGFIDTIPVTCLPDGDHADYGKWHPAVIKWWREHGCQQDYDLLHCHGYSGAPVAMMAERLDCPILFHDHGSKEGYVQTLLTDAVCRTGFTPAFWQQLRQFHENVYSGNPGPAFEADIAHMRRYDRVLATSHVSEMDFRTRYWLTNVELFYHPIYLPKKEDPRFNGGPYGRPVVAVFAGDLDNPWKCADHWLKKLLLLKDEIHLLLIGKGDATAKYASEHFPSSFYTGHKSEVEALAYLSGASVLYEPSIHHIGLNLTGISAIGLGVPVVAFPTAGHTDLIGEHEAGEVVDPCKSDEIVRAIRRVIKYRDAYSARARERFCELFHPKVVSRNIKRIYEDVLSERVGRA